MDITTGKQGPGKWKHFGRIVLLSVVLLMLIALMASPHLLKNYLNKNGVELTGRTLEVEKIKYNFFTSTLRAYNVKMYEQNNTDVFIGFDSLLVNFKPLCLLKHEFHVQQFQLVNLYSQIIQNDTLFNFTDLVEFYDTESEISQDTSTSAPYHLNLNLLEIKNGLVNYTDAQLSNTIGMEHICFIIPHIYWGGKESSANVTFDIGRGGSIHSSFSYSSQTGDYSGSANLSKLPLNIALPYIQQYMNFGDIEGALDADINFSGNQYNLENFNVNGKTVVNDLALYDRQNKEVLSVSNAEAVLTKLEPLLYNAEIGQVKLDQPYVYFALIDSMSNLEKMLVYEVEELEDTTKTNELEPTFDILINNFVIDSGFIDFSDRRFEEQFNYELSEVHVDMDSISLSSNWVEINSSMKLNKRGNLEAQIGVNPNDPFQQFELNYVLSDFQLPDLNIYSKHYTGLPILFGDMYYVNKTTIIDQQLNSKNELRIRNVEMGRKTGGLYDVPIKLALFILKDINGDVVLDIPVSGDLSNPKTHIGQIIWNTFKGFTFKIVASPFKALGNLLETDPKELEEITMVYSDTTLTGKQRRSIDLLLELERMKPELQIDINYQNDRKLERVDAAAEIVQTTYKDLHKKDPLMHRKDYLEYLENESDRDSLVMQDYERLLAPKTAIDSLISVREKMRINLVKDYLKQQNDSTSIRVFEYTKDDILNIGSRPLFSISYKLAEDKVSAKQTP